jgi:hypothetical protein
MKKVKILCLALAAPFLAHATDVEDRFGTWTEIGISKEVTKTFDVGLNTELRAQEDARWSLGASLDYKPIKYLKLGASYSFMYRYKPENRREHYRDDIMDDDHWDGYNVRDSYWSPRHRASLDVTGTVKLWKWLRVSLRERYQFTRNSPMDVNDTKYRYNKILNSDGEFQGYELKNGYPEVEVDEREDKNSNVLRSRLKLEVDKKGVDLSPFVSCEVHNNLNIGNKMVLEKVRSSAGLEYKVSKKHKITLAYILTCDIHDDEGALERIHGRTHAFNIGYDFKF